MDVIGAPKAYRAAMNLARSGGATVGFVPTMGALHEGHLSLLRKARVETDHLAMSIFVNPLQFGANEDLASYPRPLERDLEVAADVGCDTVFTPTAEEMYPDGAATVTIDPGPSRGPGTSEGCSRWWRSCSISPDRAARCSARRMPSSSR